MVFDEMEGLETRRISGVIFFIGMLFVCFLENMLRSNEMEKHIAKVFLIYEPSHATRKTTLWALRNVSTHISMRSPRKLIRADTFRHRGIEV